MNVSWPALLVSCGILIAIVLVLFWHPQRSQTKTHASADRRPTLTGFRDDDRNWSAGVFYNNPNDPALFVPKRFGFGWTVNFGHPQGRLFMIALVVMIVLLGVVLPLAVALFGGGSLHPSGCHISGC